jgi:histidinol-phosphate/aromatic aminotransferase/cobyric acid decarboxylase-like protein
MVLALLAGCGGNGQTEGTTETTAETVPDDGVLKILAIGNSFSEDAMHLLYEVAKAEGKEEIVLGNLFIGGCTLATHAKNATSNAAKYVFFTNRTGSWSKEENCTLLDGLRRDNWDIITLQQASHASGKVGTYNADIKTVVDYVNDNKLNPNAKMLYLIPTFQNPTGITMSPQKRRAVYALAQQYDVVILEDNPYGDLRFAGEELPTLKSMDTDGRVVYCGTFSKILSAGMRVGFVCGAEALIQKMVVAKQVEDVHTNLFFQMLCAKYMEQYDLDEHIAFIRDLYRDKCGCMIKALEEHFPKEVTFTRPEGGLFLWCTLPDHVPMAEFVKKASENLVFDVPGTTFNCDLTAPSQSFRLNYSTPSKEQIEKAVATLGALLKEMV